MEVKSFLLLQKIGVCFQASVSVSSQLPLTPVPGGLTPLGLVKPLSVHGVHKLILAHNKINTWK